MAFYIMAPSITTVRMSLYVTIMIKSILKQQYHTQHNDLPVRSQPASFLFNAGREIGTLKL
jgi:hypothetical protein